MNQFFPDSADSYREDTLFLLNTDADGSCQQVRGHREPDMWHDSTVTLESSHEVGDVQSKNKIVHLPVVAYRKLSWNLQ